MLKGTVIEKLLARFDGLVKVNSESKEFAVFEAKHPDVGDLIIQEDDHELIVFIGEITHGHFGSYDSGLTDAEHHARIADDLVDFITELFADECLLYKSRWSGGWGRRDLFNQSDFHTKNTKWFTWSGPVKNESNG